MSHIERRRAAFSTLIENYHNDFSGGAVSRHSPDFILNVLESGDSAKAVAALKMSPSLTSTAPGAVAVAIGKRIMAVESLTKTFIDVEPTGQTYTVTFDAKASLERIQEALSMVGAVGIIAKPGDRIAEGVVADMFIVAVEPRAAVSEEAIREAREAYRVDETETGDGSGNPPTVTDEAWMTECKILGLSTNEFSPTSLAARPATLEQASAVFAEAYGAGALKAILSKDLRSADGLTAKAVTSEQDQRDRIIRVMASRQTIPGLIVATEALVVAAAVKDVTGKSGIQPGVVDTKTWESLLDDVAYCIEESGEAESTFVRVLDIGIAPMTESATAAAKGRLVEARAEPMKDTFARALRACAKNRLIAAGYVPETIGEAVKSLSAPRASVGTEAITESIQALLAG